MFDVRDKPKMVERALLLGVYVHGKGEDNVENLLLELAALVNTLEISVMETMSINI